MIARGKAEPLLALDAMGWEEIKLLRHIMQGEELTYANLQKRYGDIVRLIKKRRAQGQKSEHAEKYADLLGKSLGELHYA